MPGSPPRHSFATKLALKGTLLLGAMLGATVIFLSNRCNEKCRRALALLLVKDPDAIASIEASSDLRFMTVAEYEYAQEEINHVREHAASGDGVFRMISKNGERVQEEMKAVQAKHDELRASFAFVFCEACHWGWGSNGPVPCGERVEFLKEKYLINEVEAKIQAMTRPSCVVSRE